MPIRILVANDEPAIAAALAMVLEDEDYAVPGAANGAEAWACVERIRPDLVITDHMMPLLTCAPFLARHTTG